MDPLTMDDFEYAEWMRLSWREKAAAHFLTALWGQYLGDGFMVLNGREAALACGREWQRVQDKGSTTPPSETRVSL